MLDATRIEQYRREGYHVLRGAIAQHEIDRLERGFARNPPLDATLNPGRYPEPGRYTLANQCASDPDLAFIIEHPTVVGAAGTLLGDDPRLSAYVIYDRTPGGTGIPQHHDYKRWRPVGSSMNWLFTIIPFCDFDADAGPLFVSPGSHHPERVHDRGERALSIHAAPRPDPDTFVDPQLQRGDLLLMNMHLWHRADGNRSQHHRAGLFNKYAAASAPPATGWYPYDDTVHAALSKTGRELLPVHSSRPLSTTRAVLVRNGRHGPEVLLENNQLPGGPTWDERAIPDWDLGNHIAPLKAHLLHDYSVEPPWMSWIGDWDEGDGRCRVYGYTLNDNGFAVAWRGQWTPAADVLGESTKYGWVADAVAGWLDPAPIRGKGLTQAQCRIDQFAY